MIIGKAKLKALAEAGAASGNWLECPATDVLALFAETERLEVQVHLAGVSAELTVHQEVGRLVTDMLVVMAERDQLKAENEALRKRLEGLVHVSDATGWEKHTCGEIAKAKALLGMEVRHG